MNKISNISKIIFTGVLLFTIIAIVSSFVSILHINQVFSPDYLESLNIFYFFVVPVVGIAGCILFVFGLNNLAKQTVGFNGDGKALGYVRNGIIVLIVSMAIIPCSFFFNGSKFFNLSIIQHILTIGGYILMLLGYLRLKDSETFHPKAKTGAQKLVIAQILLLASVTNSIIAMVLSSIENEYLYITYYITGIIGWALVIWGWAIINNATSLVGNEQNNGATDAPQTVRKPSNKVGLAGFVCALLGPALIVTLLESSVERNIKVTLVAFSLTVFVLGIILSIVGLFKKPKGWAIAGVIIVGIVVLIVIGIGALLSNIPKFNQVDLLKWGTGTM
jgi:hypothetical protein